MRRMLALLTLLLIASFDHGQWLTAAEQTQENAALVFRVPLDNEAISPATARYLQRALREAHRVAPQCVVIELNTPGGLLESTQQIVSNILASRVPIVVYVTPAGGRADSAGLFITLAAHVAAMAPGTRIGAAHPVRIGLPISPGAPEPTSDEQKQQKQPTSAAEEKLAKDTVAWARSLAELRGRNVEWAALAVTENSVLTNSEAVAKNVVDLEATDLSDLLHKIDGRELRLLPDTAQETTVHLRTASAQVRTIEMWWGERLLAVISNPNVVLLLLMFGVYGILFEFYSPGWGVAGTLGVVSLLLAFFGLSVLPVNYAGLALIAVALAMFAAEAFVTSYGALTLGGIVCLILGGTMLVDSPTGFLRVSLELLIPIAVGTGLITVYLLTRVVQAQRSPVQTGGEDLLGREAVAREKFTPVGNEFRGQIFVHGEFWQARSRTPISDGETVRIQGREGLTLTVQANDASGAAAGQREHQRIAS